MTADDSRISKMPFWKKGIVMLAGGWIVIWFSRMMLTPIYPVLSHFFGAASSTQLGMISSFYFLGYVLMQIPAGLLVDRLGLKTIVVPGFLLFSLASIGIMFSCTLTDLYIASFFSGIGCGTFFSIAYTITNVYVPSQRKSLATALVNSGTAIGSGIGLASASGLVSTGMLPWQALAGCAALFAVLMAVIFAFHMPGIKSASSPVALERKLNSISDEKTRSNLFDRHLIAAYILYFGTLYLYYLVSTWLPDYLASVRGFESSMTGAISSIVFFAGIPGALLFSQIADKHPSKKVLFIVVLELASTACLLGALNAPNKLLVVAGISLYGFLGKLAIEPILISWLGQFISPGNTATVLGLFNFFGMSASVIAPGITGVLNDGLKRADTGYYVAALLLIASALVFIALLNSRQGKKQ